MKGNGAVIALALMALPVAGLAETPAWVHEVVSPMVGPFKKDSGPKGKTLD